ncbi:hypothetical protein, partial [Nonomuraea sp. NPDC005501]|uniref:hypothetical protein n=1 Tax=Nonomuraea sp. NPDC005501 TaxID=3156884 RepID=UPI0033AA6AFF
TGVVRGRVDIGVATAGGPAAGRPSSRYSARGDAKGGYQARSCCASVVTAGVAFAASVNCGTSTV